MPPHPGLRNSDTEHRLVCAPSLRDCLPELGEGMDHFAEATAGQQFKAYQGKPLGIPAAGPRPEYLTWHRAEVFG